MIFVLYSVSFWYLQAMFMVLLGYVCGTYKLCLWYVYGVFVVLVSYVCDFCLWYICSVGYVYMVLTGHVYGTYRLWLWFLWYTVYVSATGMFMVFVL